MLDLMSLFRVAGRPVRRRLVEMHDYREQFEGHRVIRDAKSDGAWITGSGLRTNDRLLLSEGVFRLRDCFGCDYSDLYVATLEPEA